ncbi:putative reverse transcriptase domain-containing protein [Tanacetum coccineum]
MLPQTLSCLTYINRVIFIAVSTVVCSGTAKESSIAGTTGVVTIVGVYGPLSMHFRKASPFGLVSMYRKNRDRHCAYHLVASIGGRSLDPAAIMFDKTSSVPNFVTNSIMPPRIRTRSADQPVTESQGGGKGERVGRAQVGNQGNVGNQNGNVVNEKVQENVRNVLVNGNQDMSSCSIDQKVKYNAGSFVEEFCPSHEMQRLETKFWNHAMVGGGHAAYTDRFHELARLVPHLVTSESRKIERYIYGLAPQIHAMVAATEPKNMQKAVQISGVLTDDAVRNGSIKKVEKRGNMGEPSKDKNGRDDNKRTRTGNAFATIVNPVGRENTGAWTKVVPRNVNPINVKSQSPARGACYECGSTDHLKPACPRLTRAKGPGGNHPNHVVANNGGLGRGN